MLKFLFRKKKYHDWEFVNIRKVAYDCFVGEVVCRRCGAKGRFFRRWDGYVDISGVTEPCERG